MSALIASLFAVGAAPAAALDEDSEPNAAAKTSACVGDAAEDKDFSDVSEMHTFRADINCLAYYGVTIGYGDGTFGPENDVTRGQMVLFMERAAAAAGADAEAVVGDFATTGSDPVNRGDMALLIARLLVAATTAGESPVNVKNNEDGTFTVDDGGCEGLGLLPLTPAVRRTASMTAPPARCMSWVWPREPAWATSRRPPR